MLSKFVIVPELFRLTIPAALLVTPAIVPDPDRLIVPVFVKPASRVDIAPAPVMVIVPLLFKPPVAEPMVAVPLILSVLAFVKVPAPDNVVVTLSVPLFV